MAELYPSDSELAALSGTTDSEQEVLFIQTGESPYYLSFYKMLYRLLDVARRAGDLRVYKDGDLTFGVRPGRFMDGAHARQFAGATGQALTNNATNYIYLTADTAELTVNTSGFPEPSQTPHVRLATIVTAAGAYSHTDITDLRGQAMFSAGAGFRIVADAYIVVTRGQTDAASGANLLSAYAAAKALTPGGNALSPTNRAVVLLPPGRYELASELVLDTDFVDLAGLCPNPEDVLVTSSLPAGSGSTFKQTAKDVRLSNFTLHVHTSQDGSHALDIACPMLASGSDASTTSTLVTATGAFAQATVGDGVYLDWGTGKGTYRIVTKVSDDNVLVDRTIGTHSDVAYEVHQVNQDSLYERMVFAHASSGDTYYGDVWGSGFLGGTWYDCRCDAGWRVTDHRAVVGTFYRCRGGDGTFGGDKEGVSLLGYFEDCVCGHQSFGGCASVGCDIFGTLVNCVAGDKSFALGRTFGGTAIRCRAGQAGFGGTVNASYKGKVTGTLIDCVSEYNSPHNAFGAGYSDGGCSGTLKRCECTELAGEIYLTGALIDGCRFKETAVNKSVLMLLDDDSKVYASTLVASGSGKCIDAASAQTVTAAHCIMNTSVGANVTNTVSTPYNVEDATVDL